MKKIIPALILILTALLLIGCSDGTEEYDYDFDCWGEVTLWADFTEEERTARAICWQENKDGVLTLYLPSAMNEFYIWFDGANEVRIDGAGVKGGDLCALEDGDHVLTAGKNGEKEYPFRIMRSEDVPAVIITTESGSMDDINQSENHSVLEAGTLYIRSEFGETEFVGDMSEIRGRGNSSWQYEKKPYQFKLTESVQLFNMAKSRTWLLLASHNDPTLIRNSVYFELAEKAGIKFTCDYVPCDVWANGLYLGSYLLCEKIDVDGGRVEITDLKKANDESDPNASTAEYKSENGMRWCDSKASPRDITGGYLLETDYSWRWEAEDCGFVTDHGMYVVIKSPSNATYDQVKYIRDLVCDMENALYSEDGKNQKGKHFSEYMDVQSLAAMQIIDELALRLDAGLSSFYFYKDSDKAGDGKIRFAPVWDFDFSNSNTLSSILCTEDWWWTKGINIAESGVPGWYASALMHKDYRDALCKVYEERFSSVLSASELISAVRDVSASAEMNFDLWDMTKLPTAYGYTEDHTREGAVSVFTESLEKRISFLENTLGKGDFSGLTQPEFLDLPDDAQKSEAIRFVYEKGWISGTQLYVFEPDTPVTRGMLAVVLTNILEAEVKGVELADFTDVKKGEWFAESVAWCVKQGFFEEGGEFLPWQTVDHACLADVLSRATDKSVTASADPASPVTRADLALELYLAFGE